MSKPNQDPAKLVTLPPQAIEVISDAQKNIAEFNAQINTYVSGLRHGLSIPEGWTLNMEAKAFFPPGEKSNGNKE